MTKDSLPERAQSPKTVPPPAQAGPAKKAKTTPPANRKARSIPPPGASDRPRLFQPSISDEEMTTLMPSKSAERERLMARGNKAPPPAAGRPASVPPPGGGGASATPQMRKQALSVDDEGDEGRTQIRAPLAGRMLVPNSKIQAGDDEDEDERTVGLVQNPMLGAHPADAPEPTRAMMGAPTNSPSVRPAAGEPSPSVEVAFQNTPPPPAQSHPLMLQQHSMQQTHGMQQQPQMMRPQQQQMAYAPTMQGQQQPMVAHLSGAYPQQHGMPAPAMSQPAHFAVPQMAASDHRIDPPATVLTQNNGSRGSRTMSWAAALMAVGVFVGLVAAVVAGGGSDGLADTSASFVDPSRPGKRSAAQPDPNAAPAAQPVMAIPQQPIAQQQSGVQPQPFAQVNPPSVFPQVGAPGVAPAGQPGMNPPDPTAVGMGGPIANSGINTGSSPGVQPSTATQQPAAQPAAQAAAPPAQPAPVAVAAADPPRAAAPRPPPRTAPARPAAQPAAASTNDDDPPKPVAAAAPKPPKPAAPAKPAAKGGGDDDELKKAADALSKAQLENSL